MRKRETEIRLVYFKDNLVILENILIQIICKKIALCLWKFGITAEFRTSLFFSKAMHFFYLEVGIFNISDI